MDFRMLPELMTKNQTLRKAVLSILILLAGTFVSYLLKDIRLSIIFFLIWFDRLVLGHIGFISQLGLEITSFAVILTGLTYGSYFAAAYHFVISTIMIGIGWHITKSNEPTWAPFFPGPDQLVDALSGFIAGHLRALPLLPAVFIGSTAKFLIGLAKDKIMSGDKPPEVMRMINIPLNFLIATSFANKLAAFIG